MLPRGEYTACGAGATSLCVIGHLSFRGERRLNASPFYFRLTQPVAPHVPSLEVNLTKYKSAHNLALPEFATLEIRTSPMLKTLVFIFPATAYDQDFSSVLPSPDLLTFSTFVFIQ